VRHEHDADALAAQRVEVVEAPALELLVADGDDLVDHEDVGFDVHRHGEAQPHVHAARVHLHRRVDEALETGERDDLVEHGVDLALAQPEDRAVEVDVLASRELRVEAGAELEQSGHAPACADPSIRGLVDPGHEPQERRLPGAVVADEAE